MDRGQYHRGGHGVRVRGKMRGKGRRRDSLRSKGCPWRGMRQEGGSWLRYGRRGKSMVRKQRVPTGHIVGSGVEEMGDGALLRDTEA